MMSLLFQSMPNYRRSYRRGRGRIGARRREEENKKLNLLNAINVTNWGIITKDVPIGKVKMQIKPSLMTLKKCLFSLMKR